MNELFNEKCQTYQTKPIYIKACKYEEGMEDGWYLVWECEDYIIDVCGDEEYCYCYYDNKTFNTKQEVLQYINDNPYTIIEGNQYKNTFSNIMPCLIKNGYNVPEIIEENDYLADYGDGDLVLLSEKYINKDFILYKTSKLKELDMNIINKKKGKIISTEKALKDVIPFYKGD